MQEEILETWGQHQRTMLFLLEQLPAEALEKTLSTRGGRTVGKQLAHICQVRNMQLESFAKKQSISLPSFEKDEQPTKEQLILSFEQSGAAIAAYFDYCLQEKAGKASGFKYGVVSMLGYLISHEAHHRGHLLLTAKQSGVKLPDALKWGLWDWNKI